MKTKDLIKQLQKLDPESEIYRSSDENDDGEIYLSPFILVKEVTVVKGRFEFCYIPPDNNLINYNSESLAKVWTIQTP